MKDEFSTGQAPGNGDTALVVAQSRSFEAFDQWMDEQLELLVARWIHTAAPNATRFSLLHERQSRQAHQE